MALASTARLRLTVDVPKPDEWEIRVAYGLTERGGHAFMGGPGIATQVPGGHRVPLPLELLPEVAAIALDSDEAVGDFVQHYGPLGAWPNEFRLMRTATFGSPPAVKLRPLMRAREQYATRSNDHLGEFLDESRVAAGGLASLFETVLELEGTVQGRKRFSARRLADQWSRYAPWDAPTTKDACWVFLVDVINEGLRSAPMTLWYVRNGEPTDGWEQGFNYGPPFMLHPSVPESLYGVCVLELVDHVLAADRPYRICANETCGRLFSMQEGRSTTGGHRTEKVKYHSAACKAMQESREYRRREAAKKRRKR